MQRLTPYQLRALDYKRHISLTANAGSGKTFILSKRFVEIAVNENLSLNNIVAITFTDKAAGELNKKISKEIEDRLITESDPDKIKILQRVRRQLVSANISTIHSFCVAILREFSPEAGLDTRFVPIDQTIAEELIDLSIEESLNILIRMESTSEELKYLIRFLGSKRNLVSQLSSLSKNRRNILTLSAGLYSKSEEEIAEVFQKLFQEKAEKIFRESLKRMLICTKEINSTVLHSNESNNIAVETNHILKRIENASSIINLFTLIDELKELLLIKAGTIKQQGYLKKDLRTLLEHEINVVHEFFESVKFVYIIKEYAQAERELAHFGKVLINIFRIVLDKYSEKKKQRSYLDFEDILLFTEELIKKEEVRALLNERYKYIMIDEYQDTNEIQYNIFMPILNHLRSGNLFIVGDEKQSIYMFRDAELEIFNRTKNEIIKETAHNGLMELPHSFRLSPQVALFTNALFEKLFDKPDFNFNEVGFSELICVKDETEKGGIELLITNISEKELTEGELVARRILKLMKDNPDGKIKYSDIAILCRKRNAFVELENIFLKFDIPFTIVGGKGFYQRQIVYDIYNYLSFLLNKDNDAALIGILRAPFYTISDREIFEISLKEGRTYWDKFQIYFRSHDKYSKIAHTLNNHLTVARSSGITSLLRTILKDTGYQAVIASRRNSIQELANLEKLISISNTFSSQGFRTLYDFVIYLSESIETLEDESQAALTTEENAVKIMTLHQAKGLEFKAVFLFKCNEAAKIDTVRSKSISVDKNFGVLTKVPLNNNYFDEYVAPPIVGLYNYINFRKQISEIKRLLYVGVTRAANYLFISASQKEDELQNGSFLKFIVEGLNVNLHHPIHSIESRLKFMKSVGEDFIFNEKIVKLEIPITREIELIEPIVFDSNKEKQNVKNLLIEPIHDFPKREIVSATKIAVYSQCPVKYQLIYELGYSNIFKIIKKYINNFEFNYHEDEETKSFADVKGRIVHSILEKEIKNDKIAESVDQFLKDEIMLRDIRLDDAEKLKTSITAYLQKFFTSEIFDKLRSYKNFKNEFEIYSKEFDYFLYGIIDKLIIEDDKAIIIDYKSDNISTEQIKEKTGSYLPQLIFYTYLVSKLYKQIKHFEVWLVFIQQPESTVVRMILPDEMKELSVNIRRIVDQIRKGTFIPNLGHCSKCHFYLNNDQCVMRNN